MLKRRISCRPFTFVEDKILRGMLRDRKPVWEVAAALGRKPRSITARRAVLRRRDAIEREAV